MGEDISVSKNVGITPKSAKLIWQDQENLISQVSFNTTTNRVEFLSNGAGNGIIAIMTNQTRMRKMQMCFGVGISGVRRNLILLNWGYRPMEKSIAGRIIKLWTGIWERQLIFPIN